MTAEEQNRISELLRTVAGYRALGVLTELDLDSLEMERGNHYDSRTKRLRRQPFIELDDLFFGRYRLFTETRRYAYPVSHNSYTYLERHRDQDVRKLIANLEREVATLKAGLLKHPLLVEWEADRALDAQVPR